jgi:hypothetical protein
MLCNDAVKGVEAVSSEVSMLPPGYEEDDIDNNSRLDELMQKSHLLFGLNGCAVLRFTELRIWACERTTDDIFAFMYEYLTAAEAKKKFKVKIKKGKGKGGDVRVRVRLEIRSKFNKVGFLA